MSTTHTEAPAMTGQAGGTLAAGRKPTVLQRITRSTNPLAVRFAGSRWFPLWAVLRHTGRKSGRQFATPVAARWIEDGFVITMTFGPNADWVRNVLAAGGCTIRWKGHEYREVEPEILDFEHAAFAFRSWQRRIVRAFGAPGFIRLRHAPQDAEAS